MRKIINTTLACALLLGFVAASSAQSEPANNKQVTTADAHALAARLLQAIEKDDKNAVIEIIAAGFPTDLADSDGNTLLMQAAKAGKPNAAAALLAGEANPNKIAKNGATALMLAANGGHTETVKILLAAKADPNLRGANRPTALHLAANGNHIETMRALVQLNADLHAKDERGLTPLEFAFANRRAAALDYLRSVYREKDQTIPREPFNNKIMWYEETLIAAVSAKDTAKVLKMFALGFDPNRVAKGSGGNSASDGVTPLEAALVANFAPAVSLAIFAGADVNRAAKTGDVPVWWLAMPSDPQRAVDPEILKMMLKAGANVNQASKKGVAPLAFAKAYTNPQTVELLVQAGAK